MHLHRVTPDTFENYRIDAKYLGKFSEDFGASGQSDDGMPMVVNRFPRFGGGEHRQSDFEVYAEWKDIERMIEEFCEAKHPEAIALREARKLAATIKGIGWREPDPAA